MMVGIQHSSKDKIMRVPSGSESIINGVEQDIVDSMSLNPQED